MGYLICSKCRVYYQMESGESKKDFTSNCDCGSKLRYVENLDIVDPSWKQSTFRKKPTIKEVLRNKVQSISYGIKDNIISPLIEFWHNLRNKFQNTKNWNYQNWNNHYNSPYGMQNGLINSILSEFNFNNIQWIIIIPVVMVITLILANTHGILTLLIFLLLAAVGFLTKDPVIGAKNAIITGAISFFLGSLLSGSFLLLIPLTILGTINGAVCGFIGGYIQTRYN
ncbi:MFS transporter [Methanobacterium sp. MZD130B]